MDRTGIFGISTTCGGATNECSRSFRCGPVWYPDVIVLPVVNLGEDVAMTLEPLNRAPLSGGGDNGDRIGGRAIYRGRGGDQSSRKARNCRLLSLCMSLKRCFICCGVSCTPLGRVTSFPTLITRQAGSLRLDVTNKLGTMCIFVFINSVALRYRFVSFAT